MIGTRVIGAVNEIALHAVDDLDVNPLFAERTRCVHRLRECLYNTVVGDGNGGPAPPRRRLNKRLRRDDGIERTHLRMGVKFDALHLCRIFALRNRAFFNAVHKENIVADEFIVFDFPLDAHRTSLFDVL